MHMELSSCEKLADSAPDVHNNLPVKKKENYLSGMVKTMLFSTMCY